MNQSSPTLPFPTLQPARPGRLPWLVAGALAVTLAALWSERAQLSREVASLRNEALAMRTHDAVSKMQIVTLAAKDEARAKASAIVVWDADKQQGVIQIANLPRPEAGHDYQLWVSDPRHPQPVSARVLAVGDDGRAQLAFAPGRTIRSAEKFAVTLERTGGAPVTAGPIVLSSN